MLDQYDKCKGLADGRPCPYMHGKKVPMEMRDEMRKVFDWTAPWHAQAHLNPNITGPEKTA